MIDSLNGSETKVVVFDAYGTLFDVYSIFKHAESLYEGYGSDIATAWRERQIEYTRLVTMSDPHGHRGSKYYQSFEEITRLSLRYTLSRLKLPQRQDYEDSLMERYRNLNAFQDCFAVLHHLKKLGIPAAILSNGSPGMLAAAVSNAGIGEFLDRVISVDGIRLFKTAPETYGLVLDAYGVAAREVLFVSSNSWDALGARWFGFKTLWVNRQALPAETIGPRSTYEGPDFNAMLKIDFKQRASS